MIRPRFARLVALAALACASACVPATEIDPRPPEVAGPAAAGPAPGRGSPAPLSQAPGGPASFVFAGALEQGGWIRGQTPAGTRAARLGEQALALDEAGRFFAAFDRDAGPNAQLVATLADGRTIASAVTVAPRAWNIEHIDAARTPGGAGEAFMARRRPELARIAAARAVETGSTGWRQDFAWPATGRISGRFGAQRIYRGEPGSYHTGLDIAGATGTPFAAPADGVVVLAAETPFSLEGYLLIIDHGQGLNSAFLHCSQIAVRESQRVMQGQMIGRIGATGRATGPHLHWSLMWRASRLDPLLFTGPMP